MATIKSYTDIEQSKKLAEILPMESADMWYHGHHSPLKSERKYDDEPCPFHSVSPNWDKPCWSLAALLDVLPKNLDIGRPVLATNYRGYYWVSYFDEYMRENKFTSKIYNNPIDACYEMIIKLYELL